MKRYNLTTKRWNEFESTYFFRGTETRSDTFTAIIIIINERKQAGYFSTVVLNFDFET